MELNLGLVDISLLIPLTILFVFSIIPITIKILNNNTEINKNLTFLISAMGLSLAFVFTYFQKELEHRTGFNGAIIFDGTTLLGNSLVVLLALSTLMLSKNHPAVPTHQYSEHVFLLLSTTIGMFVLNFANDMILSFVGIELLSLPLYVMIGKGSNDKISKEAAFKYFVLGSFASAFLLYGVALVYGATQTTLLTEIVDLNTIHQNLFQLGMFIFFIGIFFKIALIPFHAWLPDVYQGAPTPVTAFMAAAVKLSVFFYIIRLIPLAHMIENKYFVSLFESLALVTMFVGSLAAIKQTYIKRVVAYSSIAHTGYIFMGVVAALRGDFNQSLYGIVFYLMVYIVMTVGIFALIGHFEKKLETQLTLENFKGLAQRRPGLAFCMTVFLLSLAGIPPMGGFFAKFFIFSTAVNAGLYWLVVWGVLSSVVSVYYYLKPVVYMYMYKSEEAMVENRGHTQKIAIYFATIVLILTGFLTQPLIKSIGQILLNK